VSRTEIGSLTGRPKPDSCSECTKFSIFNASSDLGKCTLDPEKPVTRNCYAKACDKGSK